MQEMKIQSTTGPPSTRISATALKGASSVSSSIRLALQAFGEQAGALLVEDLNDGLGDGLQPGIGEQQRHRDAQTQQGRDHGLRDAVGHELRIAGAGFRDAL